MNTADLPLEGRMKITPCHLTRPGFIRFEYRAPRDVTLEELKELQRLAGYDVRGYGFYNYVIVFRNETEVTYRWSCSSTAD